LRHDDDDDDDEISGYIFYSTISHTHKKGKRISKEKEKESHKQPLVALVS
jgi:hypothetical protein